LFVRGWDTRLLTEPNGADRLTRSGLRGAGAVVYADAMPAAARVLMRARELPGPLVVGVRTGDLDQADLDGPDVWAEVWRRAAALHLPDGGALRRAQRLGLAPTAATAIIPPPVDAAFFAGAAERPPEPLGAPDRPLRLVGLGPASWTQGHEHVLLAVRELRARGLSCRYRVLADGDRIPALSLARHQLGLSDAVELEPPASGPRELRAELARAHVFVHGGVVDGLPEATGIAQAMSMPLVTTDPGPVDSRSLAGAMPPCPRRDPSALAEQLITVAGDPELRDRLGREGRARVLADCSIEAHVDELHSLFSSVLAPDGEGPS
jgi:glycosyltransferase involved in cell wall biosynthesis